MLEAVLSFLFPFEDIRDRDGALYMRRWRLLGYRARIPFPVNLMLHRIVRPDEDRDPHDHPWWFVSLLLRGGYVEDRFDSARRLMSIRQRGPWTLAKRAATDLHRIAFLPTGEAWTLVLAGRAKRDWGFLTPTGWVAHERYFVNAGFQKKFISR